MSNCLLAYPDRTLSATITGGSFTTGLPLSNLKTKLLIEKARTNNVLVGSTKWDINLGVTTHIRVVALINHNASKVATIRVRCSTVADFSTVVYDSGTVPMFGQMYPYNGLPYGHPDFFTGGSISDDAFAVIPKDYYFTVTSNYSIQAKYVRVEIVDTTNSAGYFELSRCIVAPAWEPGTNMQYGAVFGIDTGSTADIAPGSPTYFDNKRGRRYVNFTLEVNEAQGLSFPLSIMQQLDISGELFFVFDPEDTTIMERQRSFLCSMRELSALEYANFDNNVVPYKLTEIL